MQRCVTKSVTLVLGGVRSGKSRFAQELAAPCKHVTFVATAERHDDAEMHAKIERHRADRPATWTTVEEPLRLASVLEQVGQKSDCVLIDCLTLFAANLLEAHPTGLVAQATEINDLCQGLRSCPSSIILVSNEVGSGVVPAYQSGRRFRDLVGEINQRVAATADTVLLMVAGLPFPLKGSVNSTTVTA